MYQRYYRVKDSWYEEELSGKDMTFSKCDEWSEETQDLRRDYIDARDAISKNPDLTSRQKYNKKKKLGEKFIADIKAVPYSNKPGKRKSKGIIMELIFHYKICSKNLRQKQQKESSYWQKNLTPSSYKYKKNTEDSYLKYCLRIPLLREYA